MQHEEIRQAVRRFAQEQLAPNAARWDREKHFPREALKGLAAMGLYGVAIAENWDGAGLDYTSLAVACEEIAAGDCSTATIVAVNNLVAAGIVLAILWLAMRSARTVLAIVATLSAGLAIAAAGRGLVRVGIEDG